MSRPIWASWKDKNTKSYWTEHSLYLWVKWAHGFHSGCKKEKTWKVSDFDKDILYVYVLLQKYQELYSYYKIESIDKTIGTQLEKFYTKLFEIRENSDFTKTANKGLRNSSSHMPYKDVKLIENLKYEIEYSKVVSRIHSLVMNLKVQDYIENTKTSDSDFHHLLESYCFIEDAYSYSIPKKKKCSFTDLTIKQNIDKDIVDHWNRKILDELKKRDETIVNLKKEYEDKIAKLIEEKDKFYKGQIQKFKKEKTAEVALRMENIYKEMDYVRSSHIKERQEMMEEIKELNDKLINLTKDNEKSNDLIQIETQTNKVSRDEEVDITVDLKMTIDCWENEDFEKINNSQELNTPKTLKIINFDKIEVDKLNKLNSFFEKCANTKWKELIIESDAENYSDLYTLIESLSILLPYVSGSIILKGFNIDWITFSLFIESIYSAASFSLKNWWIDIKSELKFELPSEFKLKNLEFSNISIKDDNNESSIQSKAKMLTQSLFQATFFKNLDKVQISKVTRFEQHFSRMISKLNKKFKC